MTPQQQLVVQQPPRRFVSRGGEKLQHGLERFSVEVTDRRCLDAGVSTGGFTDCLLQAGAAHVVAYDVGYGQVHERIRSDPRVQVFERTNVRNLRPGDIPPPPPQLLVADLSFISLRLVLPGLLGLLAQETPPAAVVLIKPQFEAQRAEVGKGGVVRDPQVWHRCLDEVLRPLSQLGWRAQDLTASPLLGPAGNVEFLAHLAPSPEEGRVRAPGGEEASADDEGVEGLIAAAVEEGRARREASRTG